MNETKSEYQLLNDAYAAIAKLPAEMLRGVFQEARSKVMGNWRTSYPLTEIASVIVTRNRWVEAASGMPDGHPRDSHWLYSQAQLDEKAAELAKRGEKFLKRKRRTVVTITFKLTDGTIAPIEADIEAERFKEFFDHKEVVDLSRKISHLYSDAFDYRLLEDDGTFKRWTFFVPEELVIEAIEGALNLPWTERRMSFERVITDEDRHYWTPTAWITWVGDAKERFEENKHRPWGDGERTLADAVEARLAHARSRSRNVDDPWEVRISPDWAPRSFYWVVESADGSRVDMNGGIIWHPKHTSEGPDPELGEYGIHT